MTLLNQPSIRISLEINASINVGKYRPRPNFKVFTMASKKQLILFTGPHCELCEQARNMIYSTLPHGGYDLRTVNVTSSLWLKKQFGLKIPVLWVLPDPSSVEEPIDFEFIKPGVELCWPFGDEELTKIGC